MSPIVPEVKPSGTKTRPVALSRVGSGLVFFFFIFLFVSLFFFVSLFVFFLFIFLFVFLFHYEKSTCFGCRFDSKLNLKQKISAQNSKINHIITPIADRIVNCVVVHMDDDMDDDDG